MDERTGLLVPISKLDRLVQEAVLERFAHRNINLDVPQFERLVPTTENLALVITDLLQQDWAAYLGGLPVRLHRVHIQETDRNGFEIVLPQTESVTLNA
jgi:6-pyruvoyltetrahydropterin/6-carboxytetrahydropterin synthase